MRRPFWLSRRSLASLRGHPLVRGRATAGALLHSDVPISFWGGVSADTGGTVIDVRHPLCGESIAGKVLAIPMSRGSCTGSQVVLELLLSGTAPAAVLLRERDEIISLGAIVAEELFGCVPMPIVVLGDVGFAQALAGGQHARVDADGTVHVSRAGDADVGASPVARCAAAPAVPPPPTADESEDEHDGLDLTAADVAMLDGARGAAAQAALRVVVRDRISLVQLL